MDGKDLRTETTPLFLDLNTSILTSWHEANIVVAKRRYYLLKGANVYHEEVIRAVYELFLLVRNSWKKEFDKKSSQDDWETIEKSFQKEGRIVNCDACLKTFDKIDAWLYEKGLTKFDTKIKYNRQIVEHANEFRGN